MIEPENTQKTDILICLKEMLDELTNEELDTIEDSLVTFYGEDQRDDDGVLPNMFRDVMTHFLSGWRGDSDE